MKILKLLLGLILILVLLAVGGYTYMGGFSTPVVLEKRLGAIDVVYATHRGSYSKLSESWTPFMAKTQELGLEECNGLAFYLDPPDTPEADLRTIIGCRIDGLGAGIQSKLKEHFPVFFFPGARTLHGSFPYVNVFSFMLGPTRVYPEMQKILEDTGAKPPVAIEIYGPVSGLEEIHYYMPLDSGPATYQTLLAAFE